MMLNIDLDLEEKSIKVQASFWDHHGCLQEDTQYITKERL